MPNRFYEKGVRKERKKVNEAKDIGLIAFRTAGSKSPIDVCTIDKVNKVITFYQLKGDSLTDSHKKRLEEEHKELKGYYKIYFKVE
jgi:hypothetical protein